LCKKFLKTYWSKLEKTSRQTLPRKVMGIYGISGYWHSLFHVLLRKLIEEEKKIPKFTIMEDIDINKLAMLSGLALSAAESAQIEGRLHNLLNLMKNSKGHSVICQ
jgi:hypothetical protein